MTHLLLLAVSTFCNPMSIPDTPMGIECRDYPNGTALPESPAWRKAMWIADRTVQFRELADPTVLVEGSTWYLYPSCGLMWTSEDCGGTWRHVPLQRETPYAPGVVKFRGRYYMAMSHGNLSVADSPTGPFRDLGKFDAATFGDDPLMPTPAGDPTFLADGDRLYLYWGVCNRPKSIWGAELDPDDPRRARAPARCLLEYDPKTYPWQATNEGAWVFKRGETYYLVYSGYGTSDPRYCGVAMKSDAPLGPFVHQKNNPFFQTPKGVVTGTGHGSVFADANGDWWATYCVVVCRYHQFERLIGLDRLEIDENGDLAVGHATETPQWLPSTGLRGATGWRALTPTCADAACCDGSLKTFQTYEKLPATVEYGFTGVHVLRAFRLVWREQGLDTKRGVMPGPFQYRLDCRRNGAWKTWVDASANATDLLVDYREGPATEADAVRLVILGAPRGITPGVVEFTVFGTAPGPAAFKRGERISFFGDSIVHGGWFEHLLELFAVMRNPGSNVRITNVGISGDTALGGLARFDWDLLPTKPDRVFTFFGMNDVDRDAYRTATPDAATRQRRAAALEAYRANQAKLADRLAAAGIGQVCLTPSPYDQYSSIKTPSLAVCNSDGLSRCAEIVRDLAADRGLSLADIHTPLTAVFAADTSKSLTGDRVHPGCDGHLMMAAEILKAMGVSPTVAEATVAASGDGASFAYVPKSLPFPKSWYYEQAEKRYPLTENLNREIIRVTGLSSGRYALAFDGRTVGAFAAEELAKGVNVALLDTPNQRTAQTAWKLMCGIKGVESTLRDIALVRVQLKNAKVDPDDWKAADAYLDAKLQMMREKKIGTLGYYTGVYAKYRQNRGEVKALQDKADGLRAQMNALRPAASQVAVRKELVVRR